MKTPYANKPAFTIVEPLIVIVVIGVLAAISAVAYTGITQKSKQHRHHQRRQSIAEDDRGVCGAVWGIS